MSKYQILNGSMEVDGAAMTVALILPNYTDVRYYTVDDVREVFPEGKDFTLEQALSYQREELEAGRPSKLTVVKLFSDEEQAEIDRMQEIFAKPRVISEETRAALLKIIRE